MTASALSGMAGAGVLRLAWARPARSVPLNTAGWTLIGVAMAAGWRQAGAWGVSVASLWTMAAALALIAVAGWRDPAGQSKGSNRRAGMLPEPGEARHLARRITTFAIVVAGGLATSVAIGLIARWAALLAEAGQADANVLAFFAVPLAWSILAFLLLMTADRKRQLALVIVPLVAAIPAVLGSVS
ncbi:MAG: hypothetical protein NTX28_05330 [Novosphingobium sp.]|nr:hypothetical protein [Novosphingobium sp.]